jgi:hypothetical protein
VTNNNDNNNNDNDDDDDFDISLLNQQQCLPKYWTLPMLANFSRHTLDPQSTEFNFVVDKFIQSWTNLLRNQMPTPNVATSPMTVPPPSPSLLVRPTTNPHTIYMKHFRPNQPPTNNNMVPVTNQPPPPLSNHGFSLPYSIPVGMNTMVPPPLPPPPTPPTAPPTFPLYPQQMYQPLNPYVQARAPAPLPTNNTAPHHRRSRTINYGHGAPKIIQIERIQNQRWYKQYSAHVCEFRQKLGKQTERWLFHG